MKYLLMFIFCYFTNLMEVYHIQGCLKEQRTKKWWENKYKPINDTKWTDKNSWIPCLIAHAFEWTFCSIIPLAVYGYAKFGFVNNVFWWAFIITFFANVILHYVIDVLRTHFEKITWSVDQLLHCIQIVLMIVILGSF